MAKQQSAGGAVAMVVQAFHQAARMHRGATAREAVGSMRPRGAWAHLIEAERVCAHSLSGTGGDGCRSQRSAVPFRRSG